MMIFIQQWNHPQFIYLLIPLMICMLLGVYRLTWKELRAYEVSRKLDPKKEKDEKDIFRKLHFRIFGYSAGAFAVSTIILIILPLERPFFSFMSGFVINVILMLSLRQQFRYLVNKFGMIDPQARSNVKGFSYQLDTVHRGLRSGLLLATFALLILAMMGPEGNEKTTRLKRTPLRVTIVLDLSRSMEADDIVPSRLTAARDELRSLLSQCSGDEVGLVLFTDSVVIQAPQTLDVQAVKTFVEQADTKKMPTHGTDLNKALVAALTTFNQGDDEYYQDSGNPTRRVLLVTDGETHTGDLHSTLGIYKKRRIHVDVLAIGSEDGAVLTDSQGHVLEHEGEKVITRLNGDVLNEIVNMTEGTYAKITIPELASQSIVSSWDAARIATKPVGFVSSLYRIQLYHIFLYPAFGVLSLYLIYPLLLLLLKKRRERKSRHQRTGKSKEMLSVHSGEGK